MLNARYKKKSIAELGTLLRVEMAKRNVRVKDLMAKTGLSQSDISRRLGYESFKDKQLALLEELLTL